MASDPLTPFLKLYKPIVGDPDGEDAWGDKWNFNADLIDSFASKQGALVEAPQDGLVYGRGTPNNWQEVPLKSDFDDLSTGVGQNAAAIEIIEAQQITQNTAINGKAPLGPNDGAIYGWKDVSWFQISGASFTITWDQIANKPATYPPTLPIPSSGVTGLDAKQASQDSAIAAINWSSLSGKPATFPPTLPIPSSGVTGLDALQTTQDSRLAAVEAKNTSQDTLIAANTTAISGKVGEAPNDGQIYSRKGSTQSWVVASAGAVVSDTAPTGMPVSTIWWNSASGGLFIDYADPNSRQWVMVNAAGMPEANKDGKPYARKDGGWFDLTATLAGYIDQSELTTQLGAYLPLTGGTLSGTLISTMPISVTSAQASNYSGYFNNTNTTGGGCIGYNGSIYGILGYTATYSLYGNGSLYLSGSGTFGSFVTINGALSNSAVANAAFWYGNDNIWSVSSSYHFNFAFSGTVRYRIEVSIFRCLVDATATLGASSYRWSTIYSSSGTINTSDETEKQDIRGLSDAEKRVSLALRGMAVMYRWKSAVAAKGDGARVHCGVIAQRVREAFEAEGLDVSQYGLWCADPRLVLHEAVRDPETGIAIEEEWEEDTGTIRYGIRYDELLAFIIGGL